MKKRKLLIFTIILLILTAGSVSVAYESTLNLEVTESGGEWETLTPMFLNCSETENTAYALINATNIDENNTLSYLQYFRWIFNYLEFEDPPDFYTNEVDFLLIMEFEDSTTIKIAYDWEIEDDGLEQTYAGYITIFVNESQLVNVSDYGISDTRKLEIHLWRSKSNQVIIQWKFGEAGSQDRALGAILTNWNVKTFNYTFSTIVEREMSFTVVFEDLSYQCGSNEGISDPVTNENWGIFEPIRQILLFILKLFIGLIDLILPEKIEGVFHHFLERLNDYIDPFLDVILWLGTNWLEILLLIHVFLIIRGVERASKGDLLGLILPLWEFYTKLFNMVMRIVGFIVNIIKAMLEAIPF